MKKTIQNKLQFFFLVLVLASPFLFGAQCGFGGNITQDGETIQVNIDQDVNLPEINADEWAAKYNIPSDGTGKLPAQTPDIPIPIEVSKEVDLASHPTIQKYGGKVSSLEINGVILKANTNSLNFDLPKMEVFMAAKGADDSALVLVGTITSIPAKEINIEHKMEQTAEQKKLMEDLLLKLAFKVKFKATFILKAGQESPTGKIQLNLHLQLKVGVTAPKLTSVRPE